MDLLQQLIEKFQPEIRKAFLNAIADVVDNAIIEEIIKALQIGDINAAFAAIGMNDAALRPIVKAIETAFETGGVTVVNSFPVSRAVLRFDVRDSMAEKWLRDHSSTLVTRIREDTRDSLRNKLGVGQIEGQNPRQTALDIVGRIDPTTQRRKGGIIGLSKPQENAVRRARQELEDLNANYFNRERRDKRFDTIVQKAIDKKKPLDADTVTKITGRYSDSLLQLRGETIARTETISTINESAYQATVQAVNSGAVEESSVERVWDSAGNDGRTRDSHLAMDGQKVGLNKPFITPSGGMLMYPGDTMLGADPEETINCRCRVRLKIDWLKDAKRDDKPPLQVPTDQIQARLDPIIREENLAIGRQTGVEYLFVYDRKTGNRFATNSGEKATVNFTPEGVAAASDPANEIIVHHNHPRSSSFSQRDYQTFSDMPGMKGLWAHGHNGSSYYVEKDKQKFNSIAYNRIEKKAMGYAELLPYNDLNLIYHHMVALGLDKQKYFKYTANLAGETADAATRHAPLINDYLRSIE